MKKVNEGIFVNRLTIDEKQVIIPRSDCHRIIYLENRKVKLEIDNKSFVLTNDNYVVLENNNFAKVSAYKDLRGVAVIVLYLKPEYIKGLSTEGCNLENCFIEAKDNGVRLVKASSEIYMIIKSLVARLIGYDNLQGYGRDEILESTMVILLAFANRGYIESMLNKKGTHNKLDIIDDIFIYINRHITEDITLDDLAKEFFMTKFHLSKIFKKATGMTIHNCILKRKLSYSKKLIEQNMPIVDVYSKCGFGGYSHFFRAFKKEFGVTPKQYYRQSIENN